MVDQQQVDELSRSLMQAVEQCRNVDRQLQLAANQKKKTEVTLAEVEKRNDADHIQFRSVGRMFVKVTKNDLKVDLNADLARIVNENERNNAMKLVLDAKKDQITKQLNDMHPGTKK